VSEVDYAAAYHELRAQLTEVLSATAEIDLDQIAPATPEWRVRDIVAHLAGVCDDVVNGRLDGVGTNDWTKVQVAKRADWSTEQLLADWDAHASAIEPQLNDFPPVIVGQMITDTYTHEQDIRGALRAPGGRDSAALAITFDWGTERLSERLTANNEGTLVLEAEIGSKELGAGSPSTRLRTERFELVRAVAGRRSRGQLHSMAWDGPFDPESLVLSSAIFTPAVADLIE
jgi:uncharacterized protein (TIGR03083 family)